MSDKAPHSPDELGKITIDLIGISENAKTYDESATWTLFPSTATTDSGDKGIPKPLRFEEFVDNLNHRRYDNFDEIKNVRKTYAYLELRYDVEWRRSFVAFFDFFYDGPRNPKIDSIEIGITILEGGLLSDCKDAISIDAGSPVDNIESRLSFFHYYASRAGFVTGILVHPEVAVLAEMRKSKPFILNGLCISDDASCDIQLACRLLSISLQWQSNEVLDKDKIVARSVSLALQNH